ncbi:tryptophan--tRNA ligase [endosymbiont of Pachyrhynchus infernalis]|uniref:tryptophan--tRNA ligase n=1 Tax=endosymbiont of Pachyrhynchus infernalis TaxID=1971488 RepID=UPI000DC6D7A8|nr:tryptophan--tRNA ligase [endosymbiont of Pachyrhynchus infernalis]BBA84939.1 tryptophan--tRNA ligase [endosymbiont of Pachyrhynchus infernalis]
MNKIKIFSGIQPSGNLTIGNYISILKQINKIQYDNICMLCIADLHIMNKYINPISVRKNILDLISILISSGIEYKNNIIFLQSDILENTQLYWILSNFIRFNELKRLNQFKEKINILNNSINLNLLNYPILMASDILLYRIDNIIVGKDQKQHIEIMNLIAKRFNSFYGYYFKIPNIIINENHYIMSLSNPNKKMSKSDNNDNNSIKILDDEYTIRKKIKKAVTDSNNSINYNKINQPGVYNLLNILSSISNVSINDLLIYFKNKSYNDLKNKLSDEIVNELKKIKDKYIYIRSNEYLLNKIIENGFNKAKKIAKNTLFDIKKLIGLNKLN